jgi:hypothetical protein
MVMRRRGLKDGCILAPQTESQKAEPRAEANILFDSAQKEKFEKWPDANKRLPQLAAYRPPLCAIF